MRAAHKVLQTITLLLACFVFFRHFESYAIASSVAHTDSLGGTTERNIKSVNLGSLITKFQKQFPSKSDYESSNEFAERCSSVTNEEYNVKYNIEKRSDTFSYNADKELLTIKIRISRGVILNDIKYIDQGSYIGQNAYGAKRNVVKRDAICNRILIINNNIKDQDFSLAIQLSPREAKFITDSAEIYLTITPACHGNSIVTSKKEYIEPNFATPVDGSWTENSFNALIKRIYVVDQRSKKVVIERQFHTQTN